jgi:ADP-L-glycero-D-manno-heptose 6-epimerase
VIAWHGTGRKRYIPFPDGLEAAYQSYTQADIAALRRAGYAAEFMDVAAGVRAYLDRLAADSR